MPNTLQQGINSGTIWRLEGSAGRRAMRAIESGHCTLGLTGHRDYYGNYVPSRHEVEDGTKGSESYAERVHDPDYCPECCQDDEDECATCGATIHPDGYGSWVDDTDGDGCEDGVHGP